MICETWNWCAPTSLADFTRQFVRVTFDERERYTYPQKNRRDKNEVVMARPNCTTDAQPEERKEEYLAFQWALTLTNTRVVIADLAQSVDNGWPNSTASN